MCEQMGDVAEVRMLGANFAEEWNRSHGGSRFCLGLVRSEEAMMDSMVTLPAQMPVWSALYCILIMEANVRGRASC